MSRFFLIICLMGFKFAFGDTPIDLTEAESDLKCGKYNITTKSNKNDVCAYCNVVKMKTKQERYGSRDKLEIRLDDDSSIKCMFVNGKITDCSRDDGHK